MRFPLNSLFDDESDTICIGSLINLHVYRIKGDLADWNSVKNRIKILIIITTHMTRTKDQIKKLNINICVLPNI